VLRKKPKSQRKTRPTPRKAAEAPHLGRKRRSGGARKKRSRLPAMARVGSMETSAATVAKENRINRENKPVTR
jgi:hypothetical protein